MPRGFLPALVLIAGLLALRPAAAGAQAPPPALPSASAPAPADTVVEVRVVGNSRVDTELVRRGFGVPVGSRFSADAVRRGIRRLHDLHFFSDVAARGEHVPGGVVIVLEVTENPRVAEVTFSGNDHVNEKDILEGLGQVTGQMADDFLLARVQRAVSRVYAEKGFTRAQPRPRYLPGSTPSARILLVEVNEGPKVRVESIRFVGLEQLRYGDVRGAMKQGTTGFLKGGVYKPDVVKEDVGRIEMAMAKHGFRDGKVTGHEALPGSKEDRVILEFTLAEGSRYYVGAVSWEGNEKVRTSELYGITRVTPGTVFNQEKVEKTIEGAYDLYSNQGYLYLRIQPDYAARDSILDLSFHVKEGEPSHVRDIVITGNTRTKERVIRRQLAIKPGDLFRRNLLYRSQRELQQLGYFSDMGVDSKPVEGSSDIDLYLNVEERQVGTASAGFGYSSSVGISGFLELGHTNLFGNGQSLNLRLERGSQRSNVELSFTEPWFRGTPTTVGMDFYTTNRNYQGQGEALDVELRRIGGALRMGRPLPIPFTRFFATYSLELQEAVDQTPPVQIIITPTAVTRQYAAGLYLTQESASTSALTLSLVRNSTDHYLYPTVGSMSRFRAEFSGGPLGGDQEFQKYELDVSRYQKLMRTAWKPVLMVRTRLGAVGELFRDEGLYTPRTRLTTIPEGATSGSVEWGGREVPIPVPRYTVGYDPETRELFLMGGTSLNPLRGYDDGEIAPEDSYHNRFVVSERTVTATDSTAASTQYIVGTSTALYPGGKYMAAWGAELQFPIADPLHGLFFFDVGGTWQELGDFRWGTLHRSAGLGLRMEVPLLGLIGFDYGYGFDRLDRRTGRYTESGWEPHIQFGKTF